MAKKKTVKFEEVEIVEKPWGSYKVLFQSKYCVVKHLIIKEGHRISLQKHLNKIEHWTILPGPQKENNQYSIQIGDKIYSTSAMSSPLRIPMSPLYIPMDVVHRAEALKGDLHIIEVASSYKHPGVEEDDIDRYHDDYNRIK